MMRMKVVVRIGDTIREPGPRVVTPADDLDLIPAG
jgi:hypothetical protein